MLRMGFTRLPLLPEERWSLTLTFSPLPQSGGSFLLHCPWSRLRRTLSGILSMKPGLSSSPRGRDFLSCFPFLLSFRLHYSRPFRCCHRLFAALKQKVFRPAFSYTGKILPPINSLARELFTMSSGGIGRKYSRSLRRRFASGYSGASFAMAKSWGSA